MRAELSGTGLAPYKSTLRKSPRPSTTCRHNEKLASATWNGAVTTIQSCCHPDLELPASRTVNSVSLPLASHVVCGGLLQQPEQTGAAGQPTLDLAGWEVKGGDNLNTDDALETAVTIFLSIYSVPSSTLRAFPESPHLPNLLTLRPGHYYAHFATEKRGSGKLPG